MVILLLSVSIVLWLILAAIVIYQKKLDKIKLSQSNAENDWLFSDFQESIYNLLFKDPSAQKVCGLDKSEYLRYCKIIHRKERFKSLAAMRMEGVVVLFIGLMFGMLMSGNTAVMVTICALSFAGFYALWEMPLSKIKREAEERLFHVTDDLPRFLSLMEKAMDLPIDQAMLVTASKFQSELSLDIMDSLNKVALGANGWQETLVDLAKTYDIQEFSELILEIISSYEQGINIRELVNRKAFEVEQTRMYAVEEHDSKIKTMVFLPIIVLKVIPLMAMVCLPMLKDFM